MIAPAEDGRALPLRDRVALITGAGGGLGRAHAQFLASRGAKIVVNDLDRAAAASVASEIIAAGGDAIAVPASVSDEAQVVAMVDEALRRWGRIDIVINNAGIVRDKSFAKMSLDDFRLVFDVHVMGAVICTKAVWGAMRDRNYGRIVMTTSSSGLYGNFGQANYGAAKLALVGLMQTLAIEGEKYNIRVNCLAPTAATQMTKGVLFGSDGDKLAPERVSPGLLALVGEQAPTRAILCAGASHFACANITLTDGLFIGAAADADAQVIDRWAEIADRRGESVPAHALVQSEREIASAASDPQNVAECPSR